MNACRPRLLGAAFNGEPGVTGHKQHGGLYSQEASKTWGRRQVYNSVVAFASHILTPKIKRQEETLTCLTQTGESSS